MVSLTSLTHGTTHTMQIFDYNGNAESEHFLLDASAGNPMAFQTELVEAIQINHENPAQIYSDDNDICTVIEECHQKTRVEVFYLAGVCIASTNTLVEGQNRITGNYKPEAGIG